MTWTAKCRKQRIGALTAAIIAMVWMPSVMAAPESTALPNLKEVERGEITKTVNGNNMNIALSGDRTIIKWNSFDIGSDAGVNFSGPGSNWAVLNRVNDSKASEIYGRLTGDGSIFIVNPHGITFGASASVDVGSLVASTMNADYESFMQGKYIFEKADNNKGAINIAETANIAAKDGYVAILAHTINNAGTISASDVAMGFGQKIELSYTDKISMQIDLPNDAKIDTEKNLILFNTKDIDKNIADSLINNTGTIQVAKEIKVSKDENGKQVVELTGDGGNIALAAANMVLSGTMSTKKGGTITTTGYETMQVRDSAKVQSEAGTWNINAKNVSVTANPDGTNDGTSPNRVSNTVLSNALTDTNVNIVASPDLKKYYSDIEVKDEIRKIGGSATSLNLTAGRNVSVDADISSAGGALNITLNSSNKEQTNSQREDGANIVRANITTNGGDFTSNGTHGTYFGLIREGDNKEAVGTARSIVTSGGNINLNGAEVLVSTGGNVLLDTGSGNVNIAGNVNSANAYYDGGDGNNSISWIAARNAAKGDTTHLAVITSALEDAVATSTINTDYTKNSQAYVGGHVVKVKTDEAGNLLDKDGQQIKFTVNNNGDIVLLTSTPVMANDYLNIDNNGKVETFGTNTEHIGWYKITNANDATDTRYVRFWAWTEGPEESSEFGKVFFVQTTGETILGKDMENSTDSNWLKEHGFALNTGVNDEVYYTNFTPKEPNDDKGHDKINGSEMALTVNYDTHNGGNEILYSQWNDTADVKDNVKHYVVEEELGKTSLVVKAQDVNMNGEIGNLTNLKSVDINAAGNVLLKGLVNVDNTISVNGTDITIKDTLNAEAANVDDAIVLRAQNNFINAVPDSANALKVGDGSHWKVYSNTPSADTLGDLNSKNFAEWSWNGTDDTSATGNLFIFKYNPTLTFTANNASKKHGETLSDTGYTFENELSGLYTNNFYDGNDTKLKEHYSLNNVGTKSDGYPASAPAGSYSIDFTNTANTAENHGYTVLFNPGTLTVTNDNPGDVRPQIDPHDPSTVNGSASYTEAERNAGLGADRVLGLQSAELPFFREESGQVKLYGTYDVSIDPDKVKMEPTAKVLPEPDQPKNQYREYEKELTTPAGAAKFMLTYNGSTFDIYPVDNKAKAILVAGDAAKNVDVESQALFAAFKEMGITLDDLDGVYTHFDGKKEVLPFRR
ncbi:two-partner secretion domain-containing protein [Selenomonas ruminantium]|uniref:Filamentous hemagglutinin family N-terminal domain-containing protein n=1 Tax=Selenomonas ruminantium TaxID=971 RepID=A0A1K1LRM7_SELRU|nr:filamentous hemagglutinin N-terminal domain-containing protein [Selenomonas ruminantium]SFW13515.1 filamentous hemagglutinin family N-terminal domain-containing protein [Selenomonas ruminantium]